MHAHLFFLPFIHELRLYRFMIWTFLKGTPITNDLSWSNSLNLSSMFPSYLLLPLMWSSVTNNPKQWIIQNVIYIWLQNSLPDVTLADFTS